MRAPECSPARQGRCGGWGRGARPALAPRSRRPRGRGGPGRRAAGAPPACGTGPAGCCATASSTWPSTRRCPSPSRATGPAPASRAAVSTPPASATRAGWGTSASTARAGSSKCLRWTPHLSPALPPSRHPPRRAVPGDRRPERGPRCSPPALAPRDPGLARSTDPRGHEAFPDGADVRSDFRSLTHHISTLSYGAKTFVRTLFLNC